MKKLLKGRAHKFGRNINTDEIIPARFLNVHQDKELARHCLSGLDENFIRRVKKGDIIVAGENFGCGSSREHAPRSIKAAGISCVIAKSFARIFFRNAINIGLAIIDSEEASSGIRNGDSVEINLAEGMIKNLTRKQNYRFSHFPRFLEKIISAGGLMEMAKSNHSNHRKKTKRKK
ncbi:MAG: 3-isopropylmalate dehydratase small subunit [Candidatus Ratteibacteria bacterium]|nr:3-isopropylmalate dehydratase small subunit [Candidatus Ratteibacteria bacterium]